MKMPSNRGFLIVASAIALLCVPAFVFSAPVVRSGDSVTIGQDQTVDGDFYAAGGTATLSGAVNGDVYVAGGTVTVNAPVSADLTAAGGAVQVHAPVGDDVRVAGGEVTLAGPVAGDVVVFGGVLRILSTAEISGDVLFWGGELVVEGAVGGSVFGSAGTARIDSSVSGDVHLRTQNTLTLGDRAEVLGSITYSGPRDIVRAQNAVVVGEIQSEMVVKDGTSISVIILSLLPMLFAALVSFLVFRRQLEEAVRRAEAAYGTQGLIGLAVFLGLPFVAIVAMLSVLGFFVGLFLLVCYIALLLASWIVAGTLIGSLIMRYALKQRKLTVVTVAVGMLALELVLFLPWIGALLAFGGMLIGLGAIVSRIYHSLT